uniref:FHA domain-containing protein n=1 Tax=Electrophorus electricus TaxID=8005 RepID=A0A4W4FUM5_ELEEL
MRGYLTTSNWIVKLQPKRTTVGRHKDSHLCLLNGGVDEHHATIEWNEAENCYVLNDLNSVHGTYVNDCRIHNAAVLFVNIVLLSFFKNLSPYVSLLFHSAVPPARVRSQARSPPITPHPPRRPRPASAGAKRTNSGQKTAELRGHFHRPGSGSLLPHPNPAIQYCQSATATLKKKMVVSDCSQRNENVIAALREEVSALRLQLSQSGQSDSDIRHKLRSLAKDIHEKKEEIQQLKEQMLEMQSSSGELTRQAIADRDQSISRLRAQLSNLKGESSKSTALVNSLQKDLLAREKQTVKLAAEVDKLRQDMRHKDAQLSNMSAKVFQSHPCFWHFSLQENENHPHCF